MIKILPFDARVHLATPMLFAILCVMFFSTTIHKAEANTQPTVENTLPVLLSSTQMVLGAVHEKISKEPLLLSTTANTDPQIDALMALLQQLITMYNQILAEQQPSTNMLIKPSTESKIQINIRNEVQYDSKTKSEAWVSTSIGSGTSNKKVYKWDLSIECPYGTILVVPDKAAYTGKNICNSTQKYYTRNYYDITRGVSLVNASAKNTNSSRTSITYVLKGYNASGELLGEDKEIVSLSPKGSSSSGSSSGNYQYKYDVSGGVIYGD